MRAWVRVCVCRLCVRAGCFYFLFFSLLNFSPFFVFLSYLKNYFRHMYVLPTCMSA